MQRRAFRSARLLVTIVLIALIATVTPTLVPSQAAASTSAAQEFVDRLNAERTSRGLSALTVDNGLAGVARSWSSRMADDDELRHNPNLRNEACCWTRLTENVGYARGGTGHVSRIHEEFMASSSHRANILDPEVDQVGVGVVVTDDGKTWVTQVFRRTTSSAPSPPADSPNPATPPVATTATGTTPEVEPEPEADPEPSAVKLRRWKDASASVLLLEDVLLLDKAIELDSNGTIHDRN